MSQKLFINTQSIKPNSIPVDAVAQNNDKISVKDIFIKHVKLSGDVGVVKYIYNTDTFDEIVVKKAMEHRSPIFTIDKNDKGEYKTVIITEYDTNDNTITFSGTLNSERNISNVPFLIYYYDAINMVTEVSGLYAHAEGTGNKAIGICSHVEGYGCEAIGGYSHVEGILSKCYGYASHVEGYGGETAPTAPYSHVEGIHCVVNAARGHAEGYGTTVNGDQGHAEGSETTADGYASHAEGEYCKSVGSYSHAEGRSNTASGSCSHVEGYDNEASGYVSHAEGRSVSVSGRYSHVEGWQTKAEGDTSHSEGRANTASGSYSHAEGYKTISSGQASHSEGRNTQATAGGAHAEGNGCIAAGADSHAEGKGTQTTNVGEHACGKYNISTKDRTIFSVGIGTSDANRRNAIGVYLPNDTYSNHPDDYSSLTLRETGFDLTYQYCYGEPIQWYRATSIRGNDMGIYLSASGEDGVDIAGNVQIDGNISYTGSCTQASDERLKDFKENIEVDLEKLSQLRKASFTFKNNPNTTYLGMSAQELQKLYPELVVENKDGYLSVDYAKLSVISMAAIDKLYEKNKELEDRLSKLEKMILNQ